MKKLLFIAILFFSSLASAGFLQMQEQIIMSKSTAAAVCAEDYAPSLTADAGRNVGAYNELEFTGFIYTPAANKCVCYVDIKQNSEAGDPTGINYHMQIYSLDGSSGLNVLLGTSNAVAGADLQGGGNEWISVLTSTNGFVFDTCVNLSASTPYGFAIFPDTDTNTTDDPEVDSTNYWILDLDDENNGSLVHSGRYTWSYATPLPHTVESTDAEDDILVKIGDES